MTDDQIVAALAEAMREARVGYYATTAEILLPTVRRVAEQWAAEELLAAAEGLRSYFTDGGGWLCGNALVAVNSVTFRADDLRARAAALTATPNHGRNAT